MFGLSDESEGILFQEARIQIVHRLHQLVFKEILQRLRQYKRENLEESLIKGVREDKEFLAGELVHEGRLHYGESLDQLLTFLWRYN